MFGHDCKIYLPKDSKVGDWFTCMCGERWERVRRWYGGRWENRGRKAKEG